MKNDFLKFLTFRGSQPPPLDPYLTIAKRVGSKDFAVLNLGGFGLKIGSARFDAGQPVISNVLFIPAEGLDGNILTAAVVTAIKERTSSGLVVFGFSDRLQFKPARFSQEIMDEVEGGAGGHSTESERIQVLPNERSGFMLMAQLERRLVAAIEAGMLAANLTLIRVHVTLFDLMNILLGRPEFQENAPSAPDSALRLPLIVDQRYLACILMQKGVWAQTPLRATPIFMGGGQAGSMEETESLQEYFAGIHRVLKPAGILEFSVLDTNTPADLFARMENALRLGARAPFTNIRLKRVCSKDHADLLALCLAP